LIGVETNQRYRFSSCPTHQDIGGQADEREPEQAGWLAMLGNVNSWPRYSSRAPRQ
jgi:hypothetical protein